MAQVRICPHCQQRNPATATDCQRCASPLEMVDPVAAEAPPPIPPPAAGAAVAAVVEAPLQTCPHADCGAANPCGESTCLYCGRPLAAAPAEFLIQLPPPLSSRYRLREQFPASGAEAEVFLADELENARQVVLKLYRKGVQPKSEVLERVARAAHAEVIALHEHGTAGGIYYEVLEHARHGSLRTLIEAGVAPELRTRIVAELASAIAHLHQLQIIHRDIKPENILVRALEPLDLALTDFGISSLLEFSQRLTGAHRTLRYSAPETASGLLTPKADWWSLGMVLIEVFCGRHPFDGLPDPVIMNLLFTKPVDLAAVTDPRWRTLCRGLLLRDPERRWGAPEVRAWLDGAEVAADDRERHGRQATAPLVVGGRDCRDAAGLAQALAAQWASGGPLPTTHELLAWLRRELGDEALASELAALAGDPALTPDERVLKTIFRLAPDLPPLYKNLPLTGPDLIALAQRALHDAAGAGALFAELMGTDVLRHFPDNRLLQQIRQQWAGALAELRFAWDGVLAAGAPAAARPPDDARPALFIATFSRRAAAGLAADVKPPSAEAMRELPWCAAFAVPAGLPPARLLVWRALEPFARDHLERLRQQQAEAEQARREQESRGLRLRQLQGRLAIWGPTNIALAAEHQQLTERIGKALATTAVDAEQLDAILSQEQDLVDARTRWRQDCCERWIRSLGSAIVHVKASYAGGADLALGKLVKEMRRDNDPEIREILGQIERGHKPVARAARHEGLTGGILALCILIVLGRVYLWVAEGLFGWHADASWWSEAIRYGVWLAVPLFFLTTNWLLQPEAPAAELAEAQVRLEDYLRRMST